MKILKTAILISGLILAIDANSATLVVSGSQLMGATSVDVGGTSYDVSFIDSNCYMAFGGCDENSDFAAGGDSAWAEAASQALLDQVLIGSFDGQSNFTAGCTATAHCDVLTVAYQISGVVFGTVVRNFSNGYSADQLISLGNFPKGNQLGTSSYQTYAVWSPSAVPIPAAAWLFGSALLGLVGIKRKRI